MGAPVWEARARSTGNLFWLVWPSNDRGVVPLIHISISLHGVALACLISGSDKNQRATFTHRSTAADSRSKNSVKNIKKLLRKTRCRPINPKEKWCRPVTHRRKINPKRKSRGERKPDMTCNNRFKSFKMSLRHHRKMYYTYLHRYWSTGCVRHIISPWKWRWSRFMTDWDDSPRQKWTPHLLLKLTSRDKN